MCRNSTRTAKTPNLSMGFISNTYKIPLLNGEWRFFKGFELGFLREKMPISEQSPSRARLVMGWIAVTVSGLIMSCPRASLSHTRSFHRQTRPIGA